MGGTMAVDIQEICCVTFAALDRGKKRHGAADDCLGNIVQDRDLALEGALGRAHIEFRSDIDDLDLYVGAGTQALFPLAEQPEQVAGLEAGEVDGFSDLQLLQVARQEAIEELAARPGLSGRRRPLGTHLG